MVLRGAAGVHVIDVISHRIVEPGATVFDSDSGLPDDICRPFQRRDR